MQRLNKFYSPVRKIELFAIELLERQREEGGEAMELCRKNAYVPRTRALLVGQEPLLAETRCLILRAAGYVVGSAFMKDALLKFKGGDFDVVILCHSIPEADRKRLTQCIRVVEPLTPVVSVMQSFGQKDAFADASIEPAPQRLLSGLAEVLKR